MSVNDLIAEGMLLFESKKIDEAIAKFNQALNEIKDKNSQLKEQNYIQSGLGGCYFEQAVKVEKTDEAKDLFTQAIMHYQQQFELAQQLKDKQVCIQEQHSAQSWIGHCYLEQAMETKDIAEAKNLFTQAIAHYQQRFELAQQLKDKQVSIQEQSSAQSWLGRRYLSQAMKAENVVEASDLFTQAIVHFQQQFDLAEQLRDEHGRKKHKKIAYSNLIKACFSGKRSGLYFATKKQEIREALFSNKDNYQDEILEDAVSTILAVLHIPPIELDSTPLAHYTSSSVCNKLFGVVNETNSNPMRIGSSSYMNDPSEGEGLLELLKLQDLELENKTDCSPHNAFFACFSSRVNDLNQFRLYGKEDGVEASGCCLVFNKNGNWLREPDISAPYRSFIKNQGENSIEFELKGSDTFNVEYESLPLYQVAYIAYKDEYIAKEKCKIWLDGSKFGIRLKPIGENKDWHDFRIKELEKALQQLIDFFKVKDNVNDQNKNVLGYIRYLFKDFAFRDEEEFRVLKMAEIGSEEIEYCKTTKSIYLPYADISNVVDEVILGTNYEKTNSRRKAEVFQHQMRQKCPNVKVSRSSLPIYANPPIKKD